MEQLKQWKAANDKNLVSSGENRHQLQKTPPVAKSATSYKKRHQWRKVPLVMKNRKLKKEKISCFLIHWL